MSKPAPFAPTITPTMEEFMDFEKVVLKARMDYPNVGIIKIRPPPEWKPRKSKDYSDADSIVIPTPIKQVVQSTSPGAYAQLNIEQNSMTVAEFRKLAEQKAKESRIEGLDVEKLERKFWISLLFNPAIYGADMEGSLMDDDVPCWNLRCLPSLLQLIEVPVPGINRPYLYFGMWKACFAWHVEDMDLYSINFLHFGKPKFWYAVPPEHASRLEALAQFYFPEEFKRCKQFLRHKSTMLSPSLLQKHDIPFHRVLQEEGEFVVTFPKAYHAGFNMGYNCAESVNFAFDDWIPYGKKCVCCKCDSERAVINMDAFLLRYEMAKSGNSIPSAPQIDPPAQQTSETEPSSKPSPAKRKRMSTPTPNVEESPNKRRKSSEMCSV